MSVTGSVVEWTEQIKWWDVLDAIVAMEDFPAALALARNCRHPDAKWLTAQLGSMGEDAADALLVAMEAQSETDVRALFVCGTMSDNSKVRRAAEQGYAPAQGHMAQLANPSDRFAWAQKQ
jgi:hypothetical protein